MSDLLSHPSKYRIEIDYQIDGDYILSVWDSSNRPLAATSGNRFDTVQDRLDWLLLELGIFLD